MAFPGRKLGKLPPPLSDGVVDYTDGAPQTLDQYAKDVCSLPDVGGRPCARSAQAHLDFQVLIFLVVLSGFLCACSEESVGRRRVEAGGHARPRPS